ncbi:Alpha/Beta hydrolase protein [Thelonectria olida]|uniref:Cutinase n=1 Tax=Thelonectria olida TaxID=1576542 RepID=A0A9P8W675_9HYPO|nr:Alpha/Beta hydrolase protein [Thelonectria olida]
MRQALAVPLLLAASTQASRLAPRDSDCKDVHVFLARGNNEPYPGRQGKLATAICSGLSSCDYEDIKYYNPLESVYCDSVFEGAKNGIDQITAYNKKCPDAMLVVSGYSQGAHVVGDVLGGGGGTFFQGCIQDSNEGLDFKSRPANKIVAAMVFGDTRHTADQPYNVLTGAGKNGLFPRTSEMLDNLAEYSDVLHSYCVETDPICAQGNVVETHLNYFDVYTDEVAVWVHGQIKAAGGDASRSSSQSETTSKATKTRSKTMAQETLTSTSNADEPRTTSETTTSITTTATSATTDNSSSETTTTTGGSVSESSASETASAASAPTSDNAATSRNSQLGGVLFVIGALIAI